MPVSDADFREYADLMATDFERCFSALTRHFKCLEAVWQDGIDRGRQVAAEREVFVIRAEALGSDDKVGIDLQIPREQLKRRFKAFQ